MAARKNKKYETCESQNKQIVKTIKSVYHAGRHLQAHTQVGTGWSIYATVAYRRVTA